MKIAFLGKGGSGKSTLSTQMVRRSVARGMTVLAIDADHNMDLALNLGADPKKFLGKDPSRIKEYLGFSRSSSFREVLEESKKANVRFTLAPTDPFTEEIAETLGDRLMLVVAGPHTEEVRTGESCSHSLAAPLKVYMPLLSLGSNEIAVVDERAGTDPVATGILNGVDLAVIVAEPTIHSVRVAGQIANELSIANVPYVLVANKVRDDKGTFSSLPVAPFGVIPWGITQIPDEVFERLLRYCS